MQCETPDLTPTTLELLRRDAERRADYVDLSSSNPTAQGLLFPPEILKESADSYWSARRYAPDPKGALAAREAIAAYYSRRTPPLSVSPDQIFITASTSEAYTLLFALLAEPGDNLLAPIPAYPLFSHLAALRDVHLKPYRLTSPTGGANWTLDPGALEDARDPRTRALLIVSPHNPTGHTFTDATKWGWSGVLPVIADEVFCEFPYAIGAVSPVGTVLPGTTVFHLNGISKMFALPDLKLGWIALSGPGTGAYSERLEFLNDALLGANALSQHLLPTLFERGDAFRASMRSRIRESIAIATMALRRMPGVQVVEPQAGTYLFPEFTRQPDEEALVSRLLASGLYAHPGYFYDEDRGSHLVISGLLEPRVLQAALERMRTVLS